MRANEFIAEGQSIGRLSKTKSYATVGLNKFVDPGTADRVYELNRVMMATAATDGTFVPDVDGESWAGRYNIAAPYTRQEQNMLNMAYKAIGSNIQDLNKGDLNSTELPSTNTVSPVTAFRGYR
jgi:hypothetical protein